MDNVCLLAVNPVPGYMDHASGTVHTPAGDVHVSRKKENGKIVTKVTAEPDVMERTIQP